jgi:hypothetical protein
MGIIESLPLPRTLEVIQTVGGRYYVRQGQSLWQCAQGDLVAHVFTRVTYKPKSLVHFTIEDGNPYPSDNPPLSENAKVLRVVRQYLQKMAAYRGYRVAS